MGIPPSSGQQTVPTTAPSMETRRLMLLSAHAGSSAADKKQMEHGVREMPDFSWAQLPRPGLSHTLFRQQQVWARWGHCAVAGQVGSAGRQCLPHTDLWHSKRGALGLSTTTLAMLQEGLCSRRFSAIPAIHSPTHVCSADVLSSGSLWMNVAHLRLNRDGCMYRLWYRPS